MRHLDRPAHIVRPMQCHEPLGRPADLEGGQGSQWNLTANSVRAERLGKPVPESGHQQDCSSDNSCCRNAWTASSREHAVNSIQSPGTSWPATGRSAEMTVAILG